MSKTIKLTGVFFFLAFSIFFSFSFAQNYGIKDRLNTKLSLSFNRANSLNIPLMQWDHIPIHPFQAKLNMRAECNYGVLNWLELGGYIGYMRYLNILYDRKRFLKGHTNSIREYAFAPTFGVNINVHLLPFWVKNKDCRWELYVTAKYGGAYLINHIGFFSNGVIMISDGTSQSFDIHTLSTRYRHEFGIGMGGGVYFWKVFGLYAEVLAGQYSYFPELFNSYYTVRVGVELKFKPREKTESKK
jgi:hypothetical protein